MDPIIFNTFSSKICYLFSGYYDIKIDVNLSDYLLPLSPELKNQAKTFLVEDDEAVFIGMQFGNEINFASRQSHSLAVLAEEISHLLLLKQAFENDLVLYESDLEMMGEIDRFLVLYHWNSFFPELCLNSDWRSIWELCDHMFSGERFSNGQNDLYRKAEEQAFKHLKQAFSRVWDYSSLNAHIILPEAKEYLKFIRSSVLQGSQRFLVA